jgi:hypothetical protein
MIFRMCLQSPQISLLTGTMIMPLHCYLGQFLLMPGHTDILLFTRMKLKSMWRVCLKMGSLLLAQSPFASPVLLVQKKDGIWWFCVDYRRLNTLTIKNKFPLPLIDKILDELTGAALFTKLDFKAGFHQVRMSPEDEYKTTFKTHQWHYQFKVMPFGLTKAPATFQCIMNSILEPFLRKSMIVFMDDILIYSKNLLDHASHIRDVLTLLRKH